MSTDSFWRGGTVALLQAPSGYLGSLPKSKGEPSHSTELPHFICLFLQSCSFGHYPKPMIKVSESRWLVNQELHLQAQFLQLYWSSTMPELLLTVHQFTCRTHAFILPSLVSKTPAYFNTFIWDNDSLPTWQGLLSTCFSLFPFTLVLSCYKNDGANPQLSSCGSQEDNQEDAQRYRNIQPVNVTQEFCPSLTDPK